MADDQRNRTLVMVADDDEDVRELVAFRLQRAGFEVVTASDGEEALSLARNSSPALAVLDVMMPKLSGIEVTRALRGDDGRRETAIVLLSASVDESEVESGFEAGADEYIRKPFRARELVETVEALLEARAGAPQDRVGSDSPR
jgi:DNA-binding response OmpR family regulator